MRSVIFEDGMDSLPILIFLTYSAFLYLALERKLESTPALILLGGLSVANIWWLLYATYTLQLFVVIGDDASSSVEYIMESVEGSWRSYLSSRLGWLAGIIYFGIVFLLAKKVKI